MSEEIEVVDTPEVETPVEEVTPEVVIEEPEVVIEAAPEVIIDETNPETFTTEPEIEEPKPEGDVPDAIEAPKAEAAPAAKCECDGEVTTVRNRLGTIKVCQDCGKKK